MACSYCGNTVAVPDALQQAQAQEALRKALTWPELRNNIWFKIIVAFLFITVVLPTCLGLIGAVAGILAAVVGVSIPFLGVILPFLGHK